MIYSICYGSDGYREAAKLNAWSAIHKGKVDRAIVYSPEDIPADFMALHGDILSERRGGGYWLWKPFFALRTLDMMQNGDYLCYSDSRMVYLRPIQKLITIMECEGLSVMCFTNASKEGNYTKRDAFISLNCDQPEYFLTQQRMSGFFIVRNNDFSKKILLEWLEACSNRNINTDDVNVLGYPNYNGFVENRHDQSAWSLITKKYGIPAFRDPTKRRGISSFGDEVNKRSDYPMILYNYHENLNEYTWNSVRRSYVKKLIKRFVLRVGCSISSLSGHNFLQKYLQTLFYVKKNVSKH